MGKTITVLAKGLFLNPNDLGALPDGALAVADNLVISRDAIIECRRGYSVVNGSRNFTRIWEWKSGLLAFEASTGLLAHSSDNGATWSNFSGTWDSQAGLPIRLGKQANCAFFTMSDATYRLDSLTGSLRPAGEESGLDCAAALSTADGTAFPAGTGGAWLAYRVLFGYRDSNDNIIFGGPSQRATVQQPVILAVIGQVTSDGSKLVTVDLGSGVHPFVTGQYVIQVDSDAKFPAGVKGTITVVDTHKFTYTDSGCTPSSTSTVAIHYTNNIRDVVVSATIPPGVDGTHFFQVYRSAASNSAEWPIGDPGDELGLVYEGQVPVARNLTQLARSTNVVTGTTSVAHGWSAGCQVMLPTSVGGGTVTLDAVGIAGAGATSGDEGTSWTNRDLPASTWTSVVWSSSLSLLVAVGSNVCATSPDGITWTSRSIPAGVYRSVCTNNSILVAVGDSGVCATSTNGIDWTSRTISDANHYWSSVVWNGSIFCAVGQDTVTTHARAATSPDGINWTVRDSGFNAPNRALYSVAWSGSRFCATGTETSAYFSAYSDDGYSWTESGVHANGGMFTTWGLGLFVSVSNTKCFTSPNGIDWTERSITNHTWTGIAFTGTNFVTVGNGYCSVSGNGTSWTEHVMPAGQYYGLGVKATVFFSSGLKVVTGTPLSTTFTYAETGTDGTISTTQTVIPVSLGVVDVAPDAFRGATLYTSPSQETIAQANAMPPLCRDMASFRDHLFFAVPTPLASFSLSLLASGAPGGVQSGDAITVGEGQVTAFTSEDIILKKFRVFTSSDYPNSPSQAISATAASFMRVVNANAAALGCTIADLSGQGGIPGQMFIQALTSAQSATFTASAHASAWSPATSTTINPSPRLNVLMWSRAGLPDAVPLLNSMNVGDADKEILRIVPTRNSLFIFKQDGIWQLTGYSPPWQLDPFDLTVEVVGRDTVVPLDNQVFCFTHHGAMKVSDTGTTLLSRPIDPEMQKLLSPQYRPTTASVSFAIADESDHKFYLYLPTDSTDTYATQAFVYDLFTDCWFRRTDAAIHGMVNSLDDRMYWVRTGTVCQERKTFGSSDYQDGTSAIPVTVQWAPKFGQDPARLNHFQEVGLLFRKADFTTAYLDYSTNLDSTWKTITITGSDYGSLLDGSKPFQLRSLVPNDMARAGLLNVRWRLTEASAVQLIQALSVLYEEGPERFGR